VLTIDADGRGRIIERRFDAEGRATGKTDLTFAA
jgi:Mrp family chromosome partitioning ATPase